MPDTTASDIKINIGCGVSGIEGWHNFDNSLTITLANSTDEWNAEAAALAARRAPLRCAKGIAF